jgi:hypothetical protein
MRMSKFVILTAFGATLVLGACSKHTPEPEPVPAPVMVEPVSSKKM